MGRLGVANHHEHLIVYVFVGDRLAVLISRRLRNDRVILDLEAAILLANNYHGFGLRINFFRPCPDRDEFDVVLNPQDFASSLRFDVLLGDVLRLVVK